MSFTETSPVQATVQIEAIQTVVSIKPTDPPLSKRVVLKSSHEKKVDVFQQRHHVLLYYEKANPEDSGWLMIGRLKESLGRALIKCPMFTGRLKWENKQENELMLVSNDSGMRLVEARFPVRLDEFLEMKGKEQVEGELAYWEDLKEQDPQFCPLSYIQVTEFECGGYAIGLSLNVLLGDSLELSGFLKSLTTVLTEIFLKDKPPTFYLPKRNKAGVQAFPIPDNLGRRKRGGQTFLYKIKPAQNLVEPKDDTIMLKRLASLCIHDLEQKLDIKPETEFTWFLTDDETGTLTVGNGIGALAWPLLETELQLNGVKWDYDNFDEVTFWEGHKPVHGGFWTGVKDEEGLIMVKSSKLQAESKTIEITVTIP